MITFITFLGLVIPVIIMISIWGIVCRMEHQEDVKPSPWLFVSFGISLFTLGFTLGTII